MVNKKNLVVCLFVGICILTGCGKSYSGGFAETASVEEQVDGKGYFSDFSAAGFEDKYQAKGTVHIEGEGRKERIATVRSEDNTEVELTGSFGSEEGSIRMIYAGPDGEETLIFEGEGTINESIKIEKGSGDILFIGEEGNNSISFDLQFAKDKDVNFTFCPINSTGHDEIKPEDNGIGIRPADNGMNDMLEGIENGFSSNWPESISRVDDEFYADDLWMSLPVDEPGLMIIEAVTEGGNLGIQIVDEDGKVYFDEKDIGTDQYEISVEHSGNYLCVIHAEMHTGRFRISMQEHKNKDEK